MTFKKSVILMIIILKSSKEISNYRQQQEIQRSQIPIYNPTSKENEKFPQKTQKLNQNKLDKINKEIYYYEPKTLVITTNIHHNIEKKDYYSKESSILTLKNQQHFLTNRLQNYTPNERDIIENFEIIFSITSVSKNLEYLKMYVQIQIKMILNKKNIMNNPKNWKNQFGIELIKLGALIQSNKENDSNEQSLNELNSRIKFEVYEKATNIKNPCQTINN